MSGSQPQDFLAPLIHEAMLGIFLFAVLAVVIKAAKLQKKTTAGYDFRSRQILTNNEKRLFRKLLQEFPGYRFFPQVGMGSILQPAYPRSDKRYMPAFRRISQKRVDFVVCSDNFEIVCLLELDDSSHNNSNDIARDVVVALGGYKTVRLKTAKEIDLSPLQTVLQSHDPISGNVKLTDATAIKAPRKYARRIEQP